MHAMMQCKEKSENLAHILGYPIWAVTNLPPLQESRPEIPRVGRGKREAWQPLLQGSSRSHDDLPQCRE